MTRLAQVRFDGRAPTGGLPGHKTPKQPLYHTILKGPAQSDPWEALEVGTSQEAPEGWQRLSDDGAWTDVAPPDDDADDPTVTRVDERDEM
jgi:hypothetical protein